MNINVNNFKNSSSTQDISNKNKTVVNENVKGDFKKSLEESKNTLELNFCGKKIFDVDDENLDKLKALVCLIDIVSNQILKEPNPNFDELQNLSIEGQEKLKEFSPVINETQNLFVRNLFSENGFLPQENLIINKNAYVKNSYVPELNLDSNSEKILVDNDFMKKILGELGIDKNQIDFGSIDKVEFAQKILSNSDGFKFLIKNTISDFKKNDVDFVKNVNQILDGGKLLNSGELLQNIKNEISQKINRVENFESPRVNQNVGQPETKNFVEIKNLNSISEIKNHSKSDNILEEISGLNKENDKNFENYLVNNVRTHDLNIDVEVFHKAIDTTVQTKFVKEFVESIDYMKTNNKTEMILKLNPEHLGKMDIKYEVVKDNVRLMIRVEKVEALKILDSTITDIKNMIRENHQINLDNIQVDLKEFTFNSNGQGSSQNKNYNENRNQNPQSFNLKLEDEEIPEEIKKQNLRSGILV